MLAAENVQLRRGTTIGSLETIRIDQDVGYRDGLFFRRLDRPVVSCLWCCRLETAMGMLVDFIVLFVSLYPVFIGLPTFEGKKMVSAVLGCLVGIAVGDCGTWYLLDRERHFNSYRQTSIPVYPVLSLGGIDLAVVEQLDQSLFEK